MKKINLLAGMAMLTILLASCGTKADRAVRIVPCPVQTAIGNGHFSFTENTVIAVENEEQQAVGNYLARLFTVPAGFTPDVVVGTEGDVVLECQDSLQGEAYVLRVDEKKIRIVASDNRGFFYGVQSLRMSLPAAIEASCAADADWTVPAMNVYDQPRFGYRGLMLDVARFFMPKEGVMRLIDCMAMLKLNNLHMHLTDDNGWRIEIKKYPRLTEVGASRVDRGNLPFSFRRNQVPGEPTVPGGFYTQEDMKEIIEYAAQRQINIIPEIDMPAHSNAALAAYPEYACPVVDKFIGVLPGLGGDNADIIYCAGNDRTFAFVEDILDEIMELFPSKYIHLGGDEAWKTYWKVCPLCQKRIRKEKLADEEALQGYFMQRVSSYVQGKGREVMGWDELTISKVPEGAVVFGWQGYGNAALKAAKQGHRFVMTPAKVLYLIRYQGPQWFEPLTYFGNNTLKDVYDYEPVQKGWDKKCEDLLMGIQGSMWTEFCSSEADVTYQILPRLAAVAEVAWSAKGTKNWDEFLVGLDNFTDHLDVKGVRYARSMYNIQHVSRPADGRLNLTLDCIRTDVEIRYTTDGTDPNMHSDIYKGPLTVVESMTLKAATFKDGKQMGEVLVLPVEWNKATGKNIVDAKGDEVLLTNGIRGSLRHSDFEWCTWNNQKDASFVLDMGETDTVNKVILGCVTNYGMTVHKPRRIDVEISEDGESFALAGTKVYTDEEIFKEDNFVEDISFDTKGAKARYVKVKVVNAGTCPKNHLRPGKLSSFYFDEIIVE